MQRPIPLHNSKGDIVDYAYVDEDVFENVNKRELQLGAASMASLVYMIDQHFSPIP